MYMYERRLYVWAHTVLFDPEGFGHFASYTRSELSKTFWVTVDANRLVLTIFIIQADKGKNREMLAIFDFFTSLPHYRINE